MNTIQQLLVVASIATAMLMAPHDCSGELALPFLLDSTVIPPESGQCPADLETRSTLNDISSNISDFVQTNLALLRTDYGVPLQCGGGQWERIAYLNKNSTDPAVAQCPSAWLDTPTHCTRPLTSHGSCHSAMYSVANRQYNKVCGRVIGYPYRSVSGFATADPENIDGPYVDGVSVTHGSPGSRSHIWSFAAAHTDGECPCQSGSTVSSPSFVGNNYFCEIGLNLQFGILTDPAWDGQGCPGPNQQCECTFNSPPWFSVELPASTTDDMEVRICADQGNHQLDEDPTIAVMELFIQ